MGRISLKALDNECVSPAKVSDDFKDGTYAYYNGKGQPFVIKNDGITTATGTAGEINFVSCPGTFPLTAMHYPKGTQTLTVPLLSSAGKGLDISQDQTDNDGVEYVFGEQDTYGAHTFTVGTHNAFIKIRFEIEAVLGTDDCLVGFRKNEAAQANVDDYDEMAAINVINGDIKVETILNAAATTTTDSTQNWVAGATHTLEVQLIGRQVRYLLDDVNLTGIPAFNFDNAEVVVPFFFFLQANAAQTHLWWKYVEVGRLRDVNANGYDAS